VFELRAGCGIARSFWLQLAKDFNGDGKADIAASLLSANKSIDPK
jgi:hypothetical protein